MTIFNENDEEEKKIDLRLYDDKEKLDQLMIEEGFHKKNDEEIAHIMQFRKEESERQQREKEEQRERYRQAREERMRKAEEEADARKLAEEEEARRRQAEEAEAAGGGEAQPEVQQQESEENVEHQRNPQGEEL